MPTESQQHIVLVGACYLDTILSVPHYPEEDSKLRATSLSVRRGGNCPNTLEVLQQLLWAQADSSTSRNVVDAPERGQHLVGGGTRIQTHLVSPLPARASAATAQILSSFGQPRGDAGGESAIDFSHCLYREGHDAPASSYVLRSAATGSRTLVNYNDLPEMTVDEFTGIVDSLRRDATVGRDIADVAGGQQAEWWWHFEGRIPVTTLECIRILRRAFTDGDHGRPVKRANKGFGGLRISVEVEKPGREGLRELAAEADVVFYSRSWAEASGYSTPEACVRGEKPPRASLAFCTWGADGAACLAADEESCLRCLVRGDSIKVVDTVGAGDTFVAGALYCLTSRAADCADWDPSRVLRFSVDLATCKVQQEGFGEVAAKMMVSGNQPTERCTGF